MKTRLLIIIVIAALGFSGTAFACLCDDLTVEQRINQADVVFSGTVYEVPWDFSNDSIAAGFSVQKVWKGADSFPLIKNGHVPVSTAKVSTACGINLIKDKEYLIYAKIVDASLHTTTCDGSWFLDGRNDDVKILETIGSTHAFSDAHEIKSSQSHDCRGPGLYSVEECEFGKLVRNIFLPLGVALPIVGMSVFFLWRKRK
ncbi:hypothetical protein [Candidatus Nitrosopumilus sediminis]|uniref:CbiN domain-containing protein n=1 Tax=Candidatus Nitrosopumilus sediminis TaxID=1229909 RepID=K0B8S8_9ARCH|nr:hypothetical protein [Candidatus Nitrosopumilus sediminis]AFS82593.1 CbiN domain-containing protein [Candidatus Nitrosopumilus sediminis]